MHEFRCGGEVQARPGPEPQQEAWATYLYMRANPLGWLREWWFHRFGCQKWFIAERHTVQQKVRATYFLGGTEQGGGAA